MRKGIYQVGFSIPGRTHDDWALAYNISILNAGVFLLFSFMNFVIDVPPMSLHFLAASLFMIGSIFSFYRLCAAGGSIAAISFYVLGAGVAFGFGTAYSIYAEGSIFDYLFSESDKVRNLPMINLLNSISVIIVLVVARFVSRVSVPSGNRLTLNDLFRFLQKFRLVLSICSVFVVVLFYLTFPHSDNLVLRGAIEKLALLPLLAVLLNFSMWDRLPPGSKLLAIFILIAMSLLGIIAAAKVTALFPIIAMIGGLYTARYRKVSVGIFVATAILYILFLVPVTNQIRGDDRYDPENNSLAERLQILGDVHVGNAETSDIEDSDQENYLLGRFAHAPYQSYLIDQWQHDIPGNSLADSWAALIPRILWPEKPNITRFGLELYTKINGSSSAVSNQAPTYDAEAFWNYGWPGVVIVSIILGLELGWFTRKWLQFIYGRSSQLGILALCVPIALFAVSVESWIAAAYIGGFATLAILIITIDRLSSILLSKPGAPGKFEGLRVRL